MCIFKKVKTYLLDFDINNIKACVIQTYEEH